jgi:hypothetical protein
MADRIVKPDSNNNISLENDDASASIKIKNDGTNEITGNTGIGTSAPVTHLEISSNSGSVAQQVQFTGTNGNGNERNWRVQANGVDWGSFEFLPSTAQGNNTYTSGTGLLIKKDGEVTVGAGDIVIGTAGKGINFEDTGGDARVLDDYEIGTFGGTGAGDILFSSGKADSYTCGTHGLLSYTKIGRAVHITGEVVVTTVSSPSGVNRLHLPFAIGDGANLSQRGACAFGAYGVAYTSGTFAVINWSEGETYVNLQTLGDGLTWGNTTFSTSDELLFSFTYFT